MPLEAHEEAARVALRRAEDVAGSQGFQPRQSTWIRPWGYGPCGRDGTRAVFRRFVLVPVPSLLTSPLLRSRSAW